MSVLVVIALVLLPVALYGLALLLAAGRDLIIGVGLPRARFRRVLGPVRSGQVRTSGPSGL